LCIGRHPPSTRLPYPTLFRSVRAQFSYRKKPARREYVRVHLRPGPDGILEARKFPREGAGLLSSLVDTDGVVELSEDTTRVEPRSEEHTSELQSRENLVCRLL